MKKILLICESGISSNFLVKSAKLFISNYQAPLELIATNVDNVSVDSTKDIDLALIAPQVPLLEKEITAISDKVRTKVIPDDVYGWANGERLVKFILKELKLNGAYAG